MSKVFASRGGSPWAETGSHPGRPTGAEPCAWSLHTAPPVRPREVCDYRGDPDDELENNDHGAFPINYIVDLQ